MYHFSCIKGKSSEEMPIMNIYLVQHGRPLSKKEDPDRPLSASGESDIKRVAAFLKKAGIEIDIMYHSGKNRAKQTAELLLVGLDSEKKAVMKDGLSPMDDVNTIADEIGHIRSDTMIVGHLPHLGKLASLLTTGDENYPIVNFQQGAVVCLRRHTEKRSWGIGWMLVPEMFL
jgi:phosphohistidine phosphatase